jgi:4-hydroxy-4-methyl-2-oxoglutarate aldolase
MAPLAAVPVSTLCDVDKSLPVVDPGIRPLTAAVRICGPAYTDVAAGEFLSFLQVIGEAAPGDVRVVQAG